MRKMTLLTFCTIMLLLRMGVSYAFNRENVYEGYSYTFNLSKKTERYFQLYISSAESNKTFVFTLKNLSYQSDLDIYVYDRFWNRVAYSNAYGTATEIANFSPRSAGYYIIEVKNEGRKWARSKLYIHSFSWGKVLKDTIISAIKQTLVESLLRALTGTDNKSSATRQQAVSAAATAIVSTLEKKRFGHVAKDVIINQIQQEIYQKYGRRGFLVNCLISFVNTYLDNIYRNF